MNSTDSMYLWLTTFKALNDMGERFGVRLQVRARPLTEPPPIIYQVVWERHETKEFDFYQEALNYFLDTVEGLSGWSVHMEDRWFHYAIPGWIISASLMWTYLFVVITERFSTVGAVMYLGLTFAALRFYMFLNEL